MSAIPIRNEGAYRVDGAFFFHGMPLDGAEETFRANVRRPIVLPTYVQDGQTLIAGTSVPNPRANHRIFHMPGNAATVTRQVNDLHSDAGLRPVTTDAFLSPVTG